MKRLMLTLAAVFFVIAVLILIVNLRGVNKRMDIDADYAVATAKVVDIQKFIRYAYPTPYTDYEIYVSFVTADGQKIQRALAAPFPNAPGAKIGQQVNVKYSVSNPHAFYVDYENKGALLFFGIFAGLSLVFLAMFFILGRA